MTGMRQASLQWFGEQAKNFIALLPDQQRCDTTNQRCLEHSLAQFHQAIPGEHPPQTAERVQPIQIRHQGLRGEYPGIQEKGRQHGGQQQQPQKRREGIQRIGRKLAQTHQHQIRFAHVTRFDGEALTGDGQGALEEPAPHHPESRTGHDQDEKSPQLARMRYLPFLTGLLDSPAGRLFCLLEVALFRHSRRRWVLRLL